MKSLFLHLLCTILATILLTSNAQTNNQKQVFLDLHNAARAQVGVPPLTWNNALEAFAIFFTDKVKQTCNFIEKSKGIYGENTAIGNAAFTAADAVNQWVAEKKNYDHRSNTCAKGKECKHYKQVVWRDTSQIGCASIVCKDSSFIVCEYYHVGNIPGVSPY
ncbi:pathogenesis-related protein 1B-like [Spinacia oleracea]|uniref:Pathogenesis-related protein 1B-like n=1 Tax=Spinacia oleracea TaxID=3562 RepID=A0A9R0IPW3_SPIOL|nr:pathogenesis-related protein 1B-like [Spinacia oleracea]